MAERELAIILRARDLASKAIKNVKGEIGTLGKAGSRAMDGLTTSIRRVGTAAAVGLVGAVGLGTRSLGHLERVTNQTNAVIASTGGAAGQSAEAIRKHAEALEQLTTADDKAIQEGQNMLLTFTKIGGDTFPQATEAVTNMAIAMASGDVANADFVGSAKQIGKALNDPIKGVTALRKAGVSFTKDQLKQIKTLQDSGDLMGAQAIILKELEVEFGNAGKAAGTGFEADMRRVQDAGEDATQALARGVMPALSRFAGFLSEKLADPAVIAAIDDLGQGLGDAAMSAIDFIEKVDFKAIGAGLKTAADAAGTIVGAFMAMPDWVKTAIVTGWGLNKLSGGALTGIIGQVASGLIKGVLGMNAGVVNINAAAVNSGGIPGVGATGGGGAMGALKNVLKVAVVGAVAVEGFALWAQSMQGFIDENNANAERGLTPEETAAMRYYSASTADQEYMRKHLGRIPTIAEWQSALAKLNKPVPGKNALGGQSSQDNDPDKRGWRNQKAELIRIHDMVNRSKDDTVRATTDSGRTITSAERETKRETARSGAIMAATTRSASQSNANQISSAVRASRPVVTTNVAVYVTAAAVTQNVTTSARYGGGGASRATDPNASQPV